MNDRLLLSCLLFLLLALPSAAQLSLGETEIIEPLPILTSGTENTFGSSMASGDFNGDQAMDLVVGMPGWDGNGFNSGAAYVLIASGDSYIHFVVHQDTTGAPGVGESNDRLGQQLAVGDFNCDLLDDVAVAAPDEAIGTNSRAGAVSVFFGATELNDIFKVGSQLLHQDSTAILGTAEPNDSFGAQLVAADFDQDGCDDLAVAASGETLNGIDQAGAIHVIFGSESGLTSADNLLFTAASLPQGAVFESFFGSRLTVVHPTGLPPRLLVTEPGAQDAARGEMDNGAIHLFAVQTSPSVALVLLNSMHGESSERFGAGAQTYHQGAVWDVLRVSSAPIGGNATVWSVESDLSARTQSPSPDASGFPIRATAIGPIDGQFSDHDSVITVRTGDQWAVFFNLSRGPSATGGLLRQSDLDPTDPADDFDFAHGLMIAKSRRDAYNSVFISSPLAGTHGKIYRVHSTWLFGDGFDSGSTFYWSSTIP